MFFYRSENCKDGRNDGNTLLSLYIRTKPAIRFWFHSRYDFHFCSDRYLHAFRDTDNLSICITSQKGIKHSLSTVILFPNYFKEAILKCVISFDFGSNEHWMLRIDFLELLHKLISRYIELITIGMRTAHWVSFPSN